MKIYVHLESIDRRFRLQNDGSFRKYDNDEEESDFCGNDIYDINMISIPNKFTYNEVEYTVNSESVDILDASISLSTEYYVYLEKNDPFRIPDINQLTKCIEFGNDQLGNTLELSIFGDFILTNRFTHIDEPYSVLRNEYCCPNNGYIGEKAATDQEYIEELYATGLKEYVEFLQTGEVNRFSDTYDQISTIQTNLKIIKQLFEEINNAQEI